MTFSARAARRRDDSPTDARDARIGGVAGDPAVGVQRDGRDERSGDQAVPVKERPRNEAMITLDGGVRDRVVHVRAVAAPLEQREERVVAADLVAPAAVVAIAIRWMRVEGVLGETGERGGKVEPLERVEIALDGAAERDGVVRHVVASAAAVVRAATPSWSAASARAARLASTSSPAQTCSAHTSTRSSPSAA